MRDLHAHPHIRFNPLRGEWVPVSPHRNTRPWQGQVETIVENRGAAMGASNPHPHGQIWATGTVPNEPAREPAAFREYRASHGTCLLCDYLAVELSRGERLVCENDAFVALVPCWAVWPFETIVIPRRHLAGLEDLPSAGREALADMLKRLTTRYDNHAHFHPPLLRSARIPIVSEIPSRPDGRSRRELLGTLPRKRMLCWFNWGDTPIAHSARLLECRDA